MDARFGSAAESGEFSSALENLGESTKQKHERSILLLYYYNMSYTVLLFHILIIICNFHYNSMFLYPADSKNINFAYMSQYEVNPVHDTDFC